jgi:hypothetical protein
MSPVVLWSWEAYVSRLFSYHKKGATMSWMDLIVDGTIVQGILALGIVGAWIYTLVVSGVAPEALSTAAMIVLGAFFGTVVERARASIRRK